jgi:hypothetical protein
MQRRNALKGILALALAERLGALQAVWASGKRLPPPGMHQISGRKVEVNGRPAREGMAIGPGDTITTGPASSAIYIVGQDAFLQRDESVVTLAGDGLKTGLRIIHGKLLAVFAKGTKEIRTQSVTFGIRGTACYIESSAAQVYFCLCYGSAEISSSQHPELTETIETRYHDRPVYLNADSSQMMVPAEVINHTDVELILLESLVGRIPPFYGRDDYTGKY